jgi:hypothetical protein
VGGEAAGICDSYEQQQVSVAGKLCSFSRGAAAARCMHCNLQIWA